jgi:hypothetical protein
MGPFEGRNLEKKGEFILKIPEGHFIWCTLHVLEIFWLRNHVFVIKSDYSTGPAAVSGSRSSPPLLAGGGTPSVYWLAGGGDLHT